MGFALAAFGGGAMPLFFVTMNAFTFKKRR
jgi:hypothetical protein